MTPTTDLVSNVSTNFSGAEIFVGNALYIQRLEIELQLQAVYFASSKILPVASQMLEPDFVYANICMQAFADAFLLL